MHLRFAVAALVSLAACDEPRVPKTQLATRERLDGFVVIDPGAHLRLRASETAPYVVTGRRDDVGRLRRLHAGTSVFRVVEGSGDFVEIESTGEAFHSPLHCQLMPRELESLSVRFFVRRDELVPVLHHPIAVRYADGTSVNLRPGVVVQANEVHEGDLVLGLEAKDVAGHVGLSYRPAPEPLPIAESDEFVADAAFANGEVRLGPKALGLAHPGLIMSVYAKTTAANRTFVTLRYSTCAEVVAVVPTERVQPKSAVVGATVSLGKSNRAPPRMRIGAVLHDTTGYVVGKTIETTGLGTETAPLGRQRCFTRTLVSLWGPGGRRPSLPEEVLTLCVSPEDLIEGDGAP